MDHILKVLAYFITSEIKQLYNVKLLGKIPIDWILISYP